MISICIPVYNFVILDTVRTLLAQADRWGVDVECVIFDDHSLPYYEERNRALRDEPRVRYLPLIENIGRSKIRNRLADHAKGEWLIFMDCDMIPHDDYFIQRYDQETRGNADVVCGGIHYGGEPKDKNELLRWRTEMRNKRHLERMKRLALHMPVTTGNFMIRRSLYQRVRFNESLTGYGREDQLFSLELEKLGARIIWTDNPLVHLGLEQNETFLSKIEESIFNLVCVWNANPQFRRTMRNTSGRLKAALLLRKLGLAPLVEQVFHFFRRPLRYRILCGDSKMWYFNFYQLGYLLGTLRMPNISRLTRRKRGMPLVPSTKI